MSTAGPPSGSSTPPNPHLPDLPLELRNLIYSYLHPPTTLSYPLLPTAITAVSHRPPPLPLLLSCHQLSSEALASYYATATFRLMLGPTNIIDPSLSELSKCPHLPRIRRLAVLLDWDVVGIGGHGGGAYHRIGGGNYNNPRPSYSTYRGLGDAAMVARNNLLGLKWYVGEQARRVERLVAVLGEGATGLRTVSVSWTDTMLGFWEEKGDVLGALAEGLAKRGVVVRVGSVVAEDERAAGRLFEGWERERGVW